MAATTRAGADGSNVTEPIPTEVWRIAGVVVFGAVMSMLDSSLVNVGLQTITNRLDTDLGTAQGIVSGYLVALAIALPVCGWLGRRFGPRRVWLCALSIFTFSSGLCAVAPNVGFLIAARILQGLSGGLLMPTGQAILGQVAGPKRIGRVMSMVGIAVVAAPAIGPAIGGLTISIASWRWLFAINLPVGLIALTLGLRRLPRGQPNTPSTIDAAGFVIAALGLGLGIYGLSAVSTIKSMSNVSVWACLAASLAAIVVFTVRSLRRTDPLLNMRMFRSPVFATANAANLLTGISMFGLTTLQPLCFQLLYGDAPGRTGLLLLVYGLGALVALPLGGRVTDRFGGGIVSMTGCVLLIGSTVPFVFTGASVDLIVIEILLFIRGIAVGLTGMPLVSAAYAAVERSQMPDAAAFVNIMKRIGGAIGVALVAVVLYRAKMTGAPVSTGFAHAFTWMTAVTAASLIASTLLWWREKALSADDDSNATRA
ncbi:MULTISPECIES: DHA2 family efflux MFS transporter permease subunit [unclassified Nocardia]|uniref:DHA2 family efflux MFS transporter permease subunit n=1 Tax=unclassified Nocardia TaxID=2637762 RepID=UPI001CE3BFF6|nr:MULTISPECIES: DHA2 family efflux MFS transporter permease subunit [unclassified Nocardia]